MTLPSYIAKAVHFDGNQMLNSPAVHYGPSIGGALISFWCNANDIAASLDRDAIFTTDDWTTLNVAFSNNTPFQLTLQVKPSVTAASTAVYSNLFGTDDNWHHILIAIDCIGDFPNHPTNVFTLYVDGKYILPDGGVINHKVVGNYIFTTPMQIAIISSSVTSGHGTNGDFADFQLHVFNDIGSFLNADGSLMLNVLRSFISADLKPVDPKTVKLDPNYPTDLSAVILFSGDQNSFAVNSAVTGPHSGYVAFPFNLTGGLINSLSFSSPSQDENLYYMTPEGICYASGIGPAGASDSQMVGINPLVYPFFSAAEASGIPLKVDKMIDAIWTASLAIPSVGPGTSRSY